MTKREDILIVRNDRLGDTILALPVIPLIRKHQPNKRIVFWTSRFQAPLLRYIKGIDLVITDKEELLTDRTIKTAFCLNPTFDNAFNIYKAGIPERIGTGRRWYSFLFNRRINLSRRKSSLHEADLNLDLVRNYGFYGGGDFPVIEIPPVIRDRFFNETSEINEDDFSGNVVVIHPGSGGSARNWPARYYKQLADEIDFRTGARVIITGIKQESETCSYVAGEKHLNICNRTNLLELSALLQRIDLLITNSTGPLHLAVALGSRTIGLFPPLKDCLPSRWGPYKHPEWALTPELPLCIKCTPGNFSKCACMEQLSVERVLKSVLELLE